MRQTAKRLSREDWLVGGLLALSEEGLLGLRTERLARKLGVTTGSFYWHFRDLADFHRRLLDYWAEEMTFHLMQEIEQTEAEPRQRLYRTFERITRDKLARYETPVRAWALVSEPARRAVARIDKMRLEFIADLLRELGFRGQQLQMRARALLLCVMAEPAFFVNDTDAQRLRWLRLRLDVLSGDAPEASP